MARRDPFRTRPPRDIPPPKTLLKSHQDIWSHAMEWKDRTIARWLEKFHHKKGRATVVLAVTDVGRGGSRGGRAYLPTPGASAGAGRPLALPAGPGADPAAAGDPEEQRPQLWSLHGLFPHRPMSIFWFGSAESVGFFVEADSVEDARQKVRDVIAQEPVEMDEENLRAVVKETGIQPAARALRERMGI